MKEADEAHDSTTPGAQNGSTEEGGVGDVEAAGETTAAEMIGGAPDTRPVGLGTLANVKVSDTPEHADDDDKD